MPPKEATPIKSTEGSSLTHEECQYLEFMLSQLKKEVNEIDGSMLKKVDLLGYQENFEREVEKKLNENKEGIEKNMNEIKEEMKNVKGEIKELQNNLFKDLRNLGT